MNEIIPYDDSSPQYNLAILEKKFEDSIDDLINSSLETRLKKLMIHLKAYLEIKKLKTSSRPSLSDTSAMDSLNRNYFNHDVLALIDFLISQLARRIDKFNELKIKPEFRNEGILSNRNIERTVNLLITLQLARNRLTAYKNN